MKPFIIFKELKDNKVELTKEEIEELISQAYNQGYTDGKKDNNYIYTAAPTWNDPHIKNPNDVTITPFVYKTPVTCSTSSGDSDCKNIKATSTLNENTYF